MTSMQRLVDADASARLAAGDATLFGADPALVAEVAPWMGWVGLAARSDEVVERVTELAARLRAEGTTDAVLLGMGGSSLASIVLSRVLGTAPGGVRLHVLDTTCPETVLAVADAVQPTSTVVLVSSKSGGTIEPLSLYAIFRERFEAALGREAAGKRFVALTDPGSGLEELAALDGFADVLPTPADVGGRYSALTAFHLLPAALLGHDVRELMRRAEAMDAACRDADGGPGALLGAFMGDGVAAGRDKLTIVSAPRLAPLGLWIEQLVAESLGKLGTGVVPVPADGARSLMGADPDRAIVVVRFADDMSLLEEVRFLAGSAPVLDIVLGDPSDLAAEFVRWEYATALAGFLLGVNPFDQPNVAEAKAATASIMDRSLTAPTGVHRTGELEVFASGIASESQTPEDLAIALLGGMRAGGYLGLLAYVPETDECTSPLQVAVDAAGWATGKAATLELGPRYLHSTGQLHKGGPATGSFAMILSGWGEDVAIPGAGHTLRELFRAQAFGDFATLAAHGRPVFLVELAGPAQDGVEDFAAAFAEAADFVVTARAQSSGTTSTDSTSPADTSTTATE
jgi:glucose-6-phosphate isomerase